MKRSRSLTPTVHSDFIQGCCVIQFTVCAWHNYTLYLAITNFLRCSTPLGVEALGVFLPHTHGPRGLPCCMLHVL